MEFWVLFAFGMVVLITHFLEGITGFGCTVLALPFAIALLGIKVAVPTLAILGLLLCLYIVIIARNDIVWKEYFTIAIFVGLGLPIGIWLFGNVNESILKTILALFMVIVSIRGLYTSFHKSTKIIPVPSFILKLLLFLGGCIHGAFSSGGPLVIIYATRAFHDKNHFRATLCMLWVTLNSILVVQYGLNGIITKNVLTTLLISLPFLAAGAVLGNWAHHKIKSTFFTKLVYGVLFLSGIFMFV